MAGARPVHNYIHTQTVPASTWTIIHNLGVYPMVDIQIVDNGQTKVIIPQSVIYVNSNTITVSFSSNFVGTATLA